MKAKKPFRLVTYMGSYKDFSRKHGTMCLVVSVNFTKSVS